MAPGTKQPANIGAGDVLAGMSELFDNYKVRLGVGVGVAIDRAACSGRSQPAPINKRTNTPTSTASATRTTPGRMYFGAILRTELKRSIV